MLSCCAAKRRARAEKVGERSVERTGEKAKFAAEKAVR